jgi:hypothetical protein
MTSESVSASEKGFIFERDVAAIYRTLGAEVKHDVSLAGNQIDLIITESTDSGSQTKAAVECKAYDRSVGVDVVNTFGSVALLLRNRGLIDRAVVVSLNGFSHQARSAAQEYNIELLEIEDLRQRVGGREQEVERAEDELEKSFLQAQRSPDQPKRVFVLMPFSSEFEDVYVLGIRAVAEKLGFVVERADSIEHNENILDVIQDRIRNCDLVIADTTNQNPNVMYEVGYAHACEQETVLISRSGENIPFDLQSINHIFYDTIVSLREKLEGRLKHMVDGVSK